MIPKRKQNESFSSSPLREVIDPGGDNSRSMGGTRLRGKVAMNSEPGKPLISIVTAVRNGGLHIEQTILSVLSQTYDNVEYIIIDGASTDGTLDIIRKYDDRIAYWISEPDRGIYDAMNKGITTAHGSLINLLNADDYLEPGALQDACDAYLKHGRPCIIYGDSYYIDDAFGVKARFHTTLSYWIGMTVCHQGIIVHRDIYNTVGLYDTRYHLAADYDFFVRAMRQNVPFVKTSCILVSCRNAGATYSRSALSRSETNSINRHYFGLYSAKRIAFLLYHYLWMPVKMNARAMLYQTLGVTLSRSLISLYKRLKQTFNHRIR